MLLGTGNCMFPPRCEFSESLKGLAAFPPSYVNLQYAAHLKGNSDNN